MTVPTLADALDLARRGWAIIPLNGKVPATAHGVKDATTDPAQIRRWWPTRANRNIGARVPSTLVVLDFDPQNGGSVDALEEAAGVTLPRTLTVHSGRGTGGQHRYYLRPPGALSSTRLPAGIDVKTDRGYCVVPPSLHPLTSQPYRWESTAPVALPESLIALLSPPATPRNAHRVTSTGPISARAAYLARHVERLPEGNRNGGLFWAACRAAEDGHPQDTFDLLEGAALVAGLSEHEAQRTIASARRWAGAQ